MKLMLMIGFAALLLSGCDDVLAPFGESRRRNEERAAQIEMEAARERAENEKKELASAIKATIAENRKLLEVRLSDVVETHRLLQMDSDELTKAIAEAMGKRSASGEEAKHEVKALNVLKAEKVNALAAKYLGGDFSAAREKFIADVKNGRAEESRYPRLLRTLTPRIRPLLQIQRNGTTAPASSEPTRSPDVGMKSLFLNPDWMQHERRFRT